MRKTFVFKNQISTRRDTVRQTKVLYGQLVYYIPIPERKFQHNYAGTFDVSCGMLNNVIIFTCLASRYQWVFSNDVENAVTQKLENRMITRSMRISVTRLVFVNKKTTIFESSINDKCVIKISAMLEF